MQIRVGNQDEITGVKLINTVHELKLVVQLLKHYFKCVFKGKIKLD